MKVLFEKELMLTPKDEKTNIPLSFQVDKDYEELFIEYSYTPKLLENREKALELVERCIKKDAGESAKDYPNPESYLPLKNLVTLSLDSPLGYVGAAHRQANEQNHCIGLRFASPGFDKTKILAGTWVLCLNVHALVTDSAFCKVRITAN